MMESYFENDVTPLFFFIYLVTTVYFVANMVRLILMLSIALMLLASLKRSCFSKGYIYNIISVIHTKDNNMYL